MDNEYIAYRRNLRMLMDARKLTVKSLADATNMTQPTISRHLTGNRKPELECIAKIADYFDVSIDWLIGRHDERNATVNKDIADVVLLYSLANPDDRNVVNAVLKKYRESVETADKAETPEE